MNGTGYIIPPAVLESIEADTIKIGFKMGSDRLTGALLRTLAASKPGAQILELGTGTGISAAWLLDGMDQASHLTTVDNYANAVEIAKRHLGADDRITFHVKDGAEFLVEAHGKAIRDDLCRCLAWQVYASQSCVVLIAVRRFLRHR